MSAGGRSGAGAEERAAPRAIEADDDGRPDVRQQPGAEAGAEPAAAARAVVGPGAAGRKVGGRGREEDEAAGDDGDDAAVARAAAWVSVAGGWGPGSVRGDGWLWGGGGARGVVSSGRARS